MITNVEYNVLEITNPVHALNGDLIGEQTLTVKRGVDGETTLTLSSQITGATLPPHEAGYLAGWLVAGIAADQDRTDEAVRDRGV